ncbi:MAG: class I SAM-dependent methyltransferase [Alphaproteobacteria bacterium]|nr:MAG: class I SAM-dependent methyltransferase [Alphaproteobacteria bacterium]
MNSTHNTTDFHATHFGFEEVAQQHKHEKVREVFDRVASRYDLMNDLMSAGMHHLWKQRLIDAVRPTPSMHLLDVAGGTGDIAFRFLKRGGCHVTISDINEEMLKVGRARAIDAGMDLSRITWLPANAEALPCHDASFDAYTVSFGIRNMTYLDKVLSEAYRSLKMGGHFLCLEFSMPTRSWLQRIYDAYSFRVIPALGEKIADDRASYQYLVESIRQFPKPEAFMQLMRDAGFARVQSTPMSGGLVVMYSGWKV